MGGTVGVEAVMLVEADRFCQDGGGFEGDALEAEAAGFGQGVFEQPLAVPFATIVPVQIHLPQLADTRRGWRRQAGGRRRLWSVGSGLWPFGDVL